MLLRVLFLFGLSIAHSSLASAYVIVDTFNGRIAPSGGFWVGAIDIGLGPDIRDEGPDGLDRFVVAQSFTAFRDYTNVTGAVGLYRIGNDAMISFVLAADDNGTPGAALGTVDVDVTSPTIQTYNLPFSDISLQDGLTYWLLASSSAVFYGVDHPDHGGALPIWSLAGWPEWFGGLAYSQNSQPWVYQYNSLAFAMYGMEAEDRIDNGDPRAFSPYTATISVPEPSTLALLGIALAGLSFARRGRVKVYQAVRR